MLCLWTPNSLESNIHQLILADLAENIGQSNTSEQDETFTTSIDLVTSQVQTRAVSGEDNGDQPERVFMVRFRVIMRKYINSYDT